MSKLALIFVCLALFSISQATFFQRPWENKTWIAENPHIWSYGVEVWWNLPKLNNTLKSTNLNSVKKFNLSGSVANHTDIAIIKTNQASSNLVACTEMTSLPVAGLSVAVPPIGTFALFISEFTKISNCMAYRWNWIDSVDASLTTLEKSIEESEKSVQRARSSYEEIESMGLCNVSYTGRGNEHCAEMYSAFAAVDKNITEGAYGKYALLNVYTAELNSELTKAEPDLSNFGIMMGLVWGDDGIYHSFTELRLKAENSKQDAEQEFQLLQESASGRKAIVGTALKDLDREKLQFISSAPAGSDFRRAGAVNEIFSDVTQRENALAIKFEEMQLEGRRLFKKGYLGNAMTGMSEVDSGYAELVDDMSFLTDYATNATSQQKTEAERELKETEKHLASTVPNPESVALYDEAKIHFEAGKRATALGDQFVSYSEAAALSRSARSVRVYEEEFAVASSLAEFEALIKRAEKDDLNVVTEKESLKFLTKLAPYEIKDHIQNSVGNIVSKSKARYEDEIVETRKRITDKISLAGPQASDLYDELARYEIGIIEADEIIYPDAIGYLKQLMKDYTTTEAEADYYLAEITANSLALSATPLISNVKLDEPADITLDLVLTNTRQYSAENIAVEVELDGSLPLFYSDITVGKAEVKSLHFDDETLVLVLNQVQPFETKRITLEKQSVIMHTLEKKTSAKGLGGGSAYVSEILDFELDINVPSTTWSDLPEGSLIDGTSPQRPLVAGKHTLSYEMTVQDAYEEHIENINAYKLGLNSRIQYTLVINPGMDLESVPIFIDTINDSQLSSMTIVSMSGEQLKNKKMISQTQYAAHVHGLEKDKSCLIKVSYLVEDTESFVEEQLIYLDSLNLSIEAEDFLEMARRHAQGGNYTEALEFIEKSKAVSRQDEKESAKLRDKYKELSQKVTDELAEINEVLSKTNFTAPFVDKLYSRKNELERLISESNSSNLTEKINPLEKVDYKWLEKELTSLKKTTYKEYNDLKERFYLTGNSSTPTEFLAFEEAFNRLETGNRLEYAVGAISLLERIKLLVESEEASILHEKEALSISFESLKSETLDVLEQYSKEASAAKGTEYSSLFTLSSKKIEDTIKETGKALDDPSLFSLKMEYLNQSKRKMQLTLDSLKNESQTKLSLLESLLAQTELDEEKRADMSQKIEVMRQMIAAGEYVNALRTGTAIAKEIDSYETPEDDGLLILGITSLAILATIGVYMLRQKKEKKPQKRKLMSFEDIKNKED